MRQRVLCFWGLLSLMGLMLQETRKALLYCLATDGAQCRATWRVV
jgi:hypothetical protein